MTLAARADWLVCKEVCIPEGADLTLIAAGREAPAAARSALGQPRSPGRAPRCRVRSPAGRSARKGRGRTSIWSDAARRRPARRSRHAAVSSRTTKRSRAVGAADASRATARATTLTLPVAIQLSGDFARVAGVLDRGHGFGGGERARRDRRPARGSRRRGAAPRGRACGRLESLPFAPAEQRAVARRSRSSFALVGGLLLNLMPCVFPVLSLKVLGFATHARRPRDDAHARPCVRRGRRRHVRGARRPCSSALRAAGEQLGWGFQLQSPAVVDGAGDAVLRAGAQPVGRLRDSAARCRRRSPAGPRRIRTSTMRSPPACSPSSSRRRARRRSWARRSAMRWRSSTRRHAGRVRRARPRHGAAVSCCWRGSRLAPRAAATGAVDGALASSCSRFRCTRR